jgi:hypothetical protein
LEWIKQRLDKNQNDYFLRRFKHDRDCHALLFWLLYYIFKNIPYHHNEIIESCGVDNMNIELLEIYQSNQFYEVERKGLLFVNKEVWSGKINKNLMLELFSFLRPNIIKVETDDRDSGSNFSGENSLILRSRSRSIISSSGSERLVEPPSMPVKRAGSQFSSGSNTPVSDRSLDSFG